MSAKCEIPSEFAKVIRDFIKDLVGTFPDKINGDSKQHELLLLIAQSNNIDDVESSVYDTIYEFCKEKYPKMFFEILYQNEELFCKSNKEEAEDKGDKEDVLELLPGLNFAELWHTDISTTTKTTIWKYLQLILFSVINNIDSSESFGDTTKLFEAINQDEFKQKIEETIAQMENVFKPQEASGSGSHDVSNAAFNQIPNAADLHDHINRMMEGKLGCLAKEIAEETAQDFNIDTDNAGSINDVFKQLLKNPTKLMDLVKTVGSKLDTKIKSGAIKESELLEEAANLVNNMKNMPGMDNLEGMFAKMGIPGMGKGGKMDMGAFGKQMEQNLRSAKMKERMRSRLADKQSDSLIADKLIQKKLVHDSLIKPKGTTVEGMEEFVFSTGEVTEKSSKKKKKKPRGTKK